VRDEFSFGARSPAENTFSFKLFFSPDALSLSIINSFSPPKNLTFFSFALCCRGLFFPVNFARTLSTHSVFDEGVPSLRAARTLLFFGPFSAQRPRVPAFSSHGI